MMKNVDATLRFSIYCKYKEDKEIFSININVSINKNLYVSIKMSVGNLCLVVSMMSDG
jgi:hypothetical protein